MRWLFRIFLMLLALVIVVPIAAVMGLFIVLNSGPGRNFAVKEINHFAGPQISIRGLGGHFPADIKLAHVAVADAKGVWLTADDLELRWQPRDLLARELHMTALTGAKIFVARAPVASRAQPEAKTGGFSLPDFGLTVDQLAVGTLEVGPALAGQEIILDVSGHAHLRDIDHGNVSLAANAANGRGEYQLDALLDPKLVDVTAHVAEPPDGLLGHFAGPSVRAPLNLDLSLTGPREAAALKFAAALGSAQLNGAGTLGLDPDAPKADVVLTVPSLAPVAAIADQRIAGSTKLHLVAAEQRDQSTTIAVDGTVDLTAAPGPAVKLVGPSGRLSLLVRLSNQLVTIKRLNITGAGFAAAISGTVATGAAPARVALNTHLALNNVALLSPGIAGKVAEDGTLNGTAQNFAINTTLTGDITEKSIPSGPFTIKLSARNLPRAPVGTVNASGALENLPLSVDAAFSRDAAGNAAVTISAATWRSMHLQGALVLAAGADIPTGHARFSVGSLGDFAAFAPVRLAGSVAGDFAHETPNDFALNVTARHLVATSAVDAVDATLHANGPVDALAVAVQASIAEIFKAPAQLAARAVVNLNARSANVSALTAAWHGLNATLQGPVAIATQPGFSVRHLALGLNGGVIRLDGALTPRLDATAAVQSLPLGLASLFAPSDNASGTISATAAVAGTVANPQGSFSLNADAVRLHSGPAAALAPATLASHGSFANHAAHLTAQLTVGPDIALNAAGLVPLNATGPINLHLTGRTDLRLTDAFLAAQGTSLRGTVTPDLTVTGTATAPQAAGTVALASGSIENISTGLNLTHMAALLSGQGRTITLEHFAAIAGSGTISGHGTVAMDQPGMPIDLTLDADHATPVSSDIVTETVNAALSLRGQLRAKLALGGRIEIVGANINIPKSLPPSVAKLPILNRGEPPPPPQPPPDVRLDLTIRATNRIFVRGDGLFAELGGKLTISGTAADPDPEGGFTLIRGDFSLAGRNLQFTQGTVGFNGGGFIPTLDLEATAVNSTVTSTLIVGGTAAAPTITLTSTPPLPSDEILANLLFGTGTQSLTPFQAASLAAALAQLSGVGGGANPLDSVRSALGLDELSLGGSGNGPPSIQAGRYVAPGIYVGAQQATNGQGTQATVEINLYKGLKLNTATGTSASGGAGASSSVGLTYQFNY